MSLSNILNEIEKNLPQAEAVVNSEPDSTYRGRLGLKKAAAETVSRLRNTYREELMTSTVFIVVTGEKRNAFAELASSDTFGCFSVDPEEFFHDLAARVSPPQIRPSLYGREGVRSLFSIAQNVLYDRAQELEIREYPPLAFNDKYNRAINSADDFAALLKQAINDQVGSEIVGLAAIYSIVDAAITRKHSAVVTPIILNTADEKFALDLKNSLGKLKSKTFLVAAGKASKSLTASGAVVVKTPNEESVGEALTDIRNKL